MPRLPRERARNALVAALLGLASIPVGLLLVAEDERALESEPSTASDRFTDAATAAARATRHTPPLEAPASPSSSPDVAIARRHVELRPVELRGRIIDVATRRPIANATFGGGSRVVPADGRGEFRILQGSAGSFAFVVEAEGYCQLHGRLEAGDSGSPAWIELPLLASSPVEGRVIDVDGRPVAEAAVSTVALRAAETAEPPPGTPAGWNHVPEGLGVRVGTDADGRFRLPGLVPYSKGLGCGWCARGSSPRSGRSPPLGRAWRRVTRSS